MKRMHLDVLVIIGSLPNRYEFNYALGIDVLEILDADGAKYQVLNMICLGTCFQLAEVVRAGPGQPTSARCLEAIKKRWISWAGNPSTVQCDRGLHNRGVLAQYMSAQGIQVYHAPLETPEAIGRVERHGGVLMGMARKVISQTQARGESQIQSVWMNLASLRTAYLGMEATPHPNGYLVRPLGRHHPWCPRINLQTSEQ